MILLYKTKMIIILSALLIAITAIFICLSLNEKNVNDTETPKSVENNEKSLTGKTVIIDAGHGGFDAGASGNGAVEKEINLKVALKLKDEVTECGGKAVMTRESDNSTESKDKEKGKSAKKSDLQNRKNMMQECNADIFISIHMNKFESSKYWGTQVFYSASLEESKRLGETLQNEIALFLNDGNKRVAKKSGNDIFILKNAPIPACIVECGFLSNPDEAKKLLSDEYQGKMAKAIKNGIVRYFKS